MRFLAVAPIVLLAVPAGAYQVKHTDAGEPLRWTSGAITVEAALEDTPADMNAGEARRALAGACEAWQAVLPAEVPLVMKDGGGEGNLVAWVHEGWDEDFDPVALAMTVTSYQPETGRITGADIFVNAERYAWVAADPVGGCSVSYDLQNVLTHEVGHLLGLGHETEIAGATMYPQAGSCETEKRTLEDDDRAGIDYLYVAVGALPENDGGSMMPLGCSVAAGRGPGSVLVIVLVAGLLAMRRRWGLASLVIGLAAATASAATVRRLSLGELGAGAATVARGQIVASRTVRVGERVYTETTVAVSECWKGTCGGRLVVRELGGEIDGRGTIVEGAPALGTEGEVVLFLRVRKDGTYAVSGMAQGAFRVERTPAGRIRLRRDLDGLHFAGGERGEESFALPDVRRAAR